MVRGQSQIARVLVVEDEEAMRLGITSLLEGEGYQVTSVADGLAVTAAVDDLEPHVVLLDVDLGRPPDGLAVARALARAARPPLVIFITAAGQDEAIDRGYAIDPADYIRKPFRPQELLHRVRAVLRTSGVLRAAVLRVHDVTLEEAGRQVRRGGALVELTSKEHDLLLALMRRAGDVVTKLQLRTEVLGHRHGGDHAIEVHVSALRHKLEEHGPRLIETVHGLGYVIRP